MLPKTMYGGLGVTLISFLVIYIGGPYGNENWTGAMVFTFITFPFFLLTLLTAVMVVIKHHRQGDIHFKVGLSLLILFVILAVAPLIYLNLR